MLSTERVSEESVCVRHGKSFKLIMLDRNIALKYKLLLFYCFY